MKEKIKKFALELGVDDIGFANVRDYKSPSSPPVKDLFENGKSLIVLAFQELDNCDSESKQLMFAGRTAQGEFSKSCSYRLARFLQKEFKAKVLFIPFSTPFDLSKGPVGDISLRHAAVAAGLGNFGRHNLVIHPTMGSRVFFTALLTDLEMESDPPIREKICLDCDVCVANCPAQALEQEGKTDVLRCIKHSQPYGVMSNIQFWHKFIDSTPEEQKELFKSLDYRYLYQANSLGMQYYCFNCLKSCPIGRD